VIYSGIVVHLQGADGNYLQAAPTCYELAKWQPAKSTATRWRLIFDGNGSSQVPDVSIQPMDSAKNVQLTSNMFTTAGGKMKFGNVSRLDLQWRFRNFRAQAKSAWRVCAPTPIVSNVATTTTTTGLCSVWTGSLWTAYSGKYLNSVPALAGYFQSSARRSPWAIISDTPSAQVLQTKMVVHLQGETGKYLDCSGASGEVPVWSARRSSTTRWQLIFPGFVTNKTLGNVVIRSMCEKDWQLKSDVLTKNGTLSFGSIGNIRTPSSVWWIDHIRQQETFVWRAC